MAQAREATVKLRVVAEKYMEMETKTGKTRIVSAPWTTNVVIQNKKKYGPGEVFDVEPVLDANGAVIKTAKEVALDLLDTGAVEWANRPPKPFKPPSLEHKITLTNGIVYGADKEGKIPTRTGPGQSPNYEEDDYEQGY